MSRRDPLLAVGALALVLGATVSLDTVVDGDVWRLHVWGAPVLAIGIAAAGRAAGVGAGLSAAASGMVWLALTVVLHLETDGLLPGREQAAEFISLWAAGLTDLSREPPPLRARPGLLLVLGAAAWWAGHLTHEMIVRLRRPGITILAIGVLWGAPLAVHDGDGRTWPVVVPFLAAGALVLLLDPDLDLRRWTGAQDRRPRLSPTGVALGATAIALAALFPGAMPGYGEEAWVDLSPTEGARGYQPIVDVTRRLQQPTPRDLLEVRSERPVYLRLAGLDTFDGGTWRLGPAEDRSYSPTDVVAADRPLPPEVEIREREMLTVEVENLGLENVFVPAPYHPLRVLGSAASRMVYSTEGSFLATSDVLEGEPALVPGLSYTVEAAVPTPTAASLREVGWDALEDPSYGPWTTLPTEYGDLATVVDGIREEADAASPFELALAVQAFFRDPDNFRYSTDVSPLRSDAALERFVTEDRVGYCEYFATAMAVMLRQEGIPARVAVGFRIGDRVEDDTYVVTSDHAHAWVEALFPGYGWIQFEPTPALPDTLVPSETIAAPDFPAGQAPSDPGQSVAVVEDPLDGPTGSDAPLEPESVDTSPGPGRSPAVVLATALLALTLAVVVTVAWWAGPLRRRPRPDLPTSLRVLGAQRRLYEDARALGVGREEHETAHEVARRWEREGRVEGQPARRLATIAQAAAFGGETGAQAGEDAERLAGHLSDQLRGSVPRRGQLLAPLRAPLNRAADGGRELVGTVRGRLGRDGS